VISGSPQPHYFACFAMISKLSLGAAQACALSFSAANPASRSGSSLGVARAIVSPTQLQRKPHTARDIDGSNFHVRSAENRLTSWRTASNINTPFCYVSPAIYFTRPRRQRGECSSIPDRSV
jgi:hypothetical protein